MRNATSTLADGSRAPQMVGRFAPSPTGRMHAGNIFAALISWLVARQGKGSFLLRIEDLDPDRSKQCYIDAIMADLEYLGLEWDAKPLFQSSRAEAYRDALERLSEKGLVYPCYCTRADLHAASAPHPGDAGRYPGTCKGAKGQRPEEERRMSALRLCVPDKVMGFEDAFQGGCSLNLASKTGDFVVQRKDGTCAYQLAVVIDDAEQSVNTVVRGVDLLESTPQQIYLQELLGLPVPGYAHFPLLVDKGGRRLSKRQKDAGFEALKARFPRPEHLIGHLAGLSGITENSEPVTAAELIGKADLGSLKDVRQIMWR